MESVVYLFMCQLSAVYWYWRRLQLQKTKNKRLFLCLPFTSFLRDCTILASHTYFNKTFHISEIEVLNNWKNWNNNRTTHMNKNISIWFMLYGILNSKLQYYILTRVTKIFKRIKNVEQKQTVMTSNDICLCYFWLFCSNAANE